MNLSIGVSYAWNKINKS